MARIELPGKNLIQGYSGGGEGSPAAAAAPWAALESVGNQVQQMGDQVTNVLVRAKQADTRRKAAEMELELDEVGNQYQLEVLKNPNASPEEIMGGLEKRLGAVRAKYMGANMAPDEQDVLGGRYAQLSSRMTQETMKHAVIGSIQNSKQAAINLIKAGELAGDVGRRDQGLADLGHLLPAADIEAARMESDRNMASTRITADITANPQEWKTKLDSPDVLKDYPGLGHGDLPRLKDIARGASADMAKDATDKFQDGVATGDIKTPEDIDRVFKDKVSPSTLEGMKGHLARRYDAAEQAAKQTPEYSQERAAQASRLLDGMAGADDFEDRYAKASFLIDDMQDSPLKRRLDAQLKETKRGKDFQVKSHADAAMKALDAYDLREQAKLPKRPEKLSISNAIDAGFLKDPAKLKDIGFNDDQSKAIIEAKTDAERKNLVQSMWTQRGAARADIDQTVWKTAEGIRLGADNVDLITPEQEDAIITAKLEADQRAGARKQKLAEFLELNPEAKQEAIDAKVLEIGGEETHRELKSGIYDRSTSGGPQGASDSTAAVPVGKDLTEIVKNFEASSGFHRAAYWDYGQWSIGYGTKSKEGEVIDQAEADARLSKELGSHRVRVEAAAKKVGISFTPNEMDALTSFDFNTGKIETLLAGGTRTKAEIANTMLLYRNADGQRLRGLEKRRMAERHLFVYGHANNRPAPAATAATEPPKNTGDLAQYNVR